MTQQEIKAVVLEMLSSVAPEAELEALQPDVNLREQLDIDSMDMLNFVIGLHKRLNVDIPEKDYVKLMTLDGCLAYLTDACGVSSGV